MKYLDPDGACAAPVGLQEGQVGICIETFIAAPTIMFVGEGDGRSFAPNDPEATYRTSLRMIVAPESGSILSQRVDAGRSQLIPPFSAVGAQGSTTVGIVKGKHPDGTTFHISITGKNGLSTFNPLGEIELDLTLSVPKEGRAEVSRVDSKRFPSLEGFGYVMVQGELVTYRLFVVEETKPGALNGEKENVYATNGAPDE